MHVLKLICGYIPLLSSINIKIKFYYMKNKYTRHVMYTCTVDRAVTIMTLYKNSTFYSMIQFHHTNVVEQYHFLDI